MWCKVSKCGVGLPRACDASQVERVLKGNIKKG